MSSKSFEGCIFYLLWYRCCTKRMGAATQRMGLGDGNQNNIIELKKFNSKINWNLENK